MKIKFCFLWLSLVCIICFILQNLSSWFTELFVLNKGAVYNYEVWRFVSSIFLHLGIIHLAYNLFALLFFGFLLEKLIGSKRFLILFFASGIIANLISIWFYNSSLGASGAIYGILGTLIVIKPMMIVWAFGLILPMFIAGILWVIGDLIGLFIPSNIGHIAHLSGIFVGILFGIYLLLKQKKKKEIKVVVPEEYVRLWEDRFMGY